jgi:hypothetical protein
LWYNGKVIPAHPVKAYRGFTWLVISYLLPGSVLKFSRTVFSLPLLLFHIKEGSRKAGSLDVACVKLGEIVEKRK